MFLVGQSRIREFRGHTYLACAADTHKDQTYFLWMLTEDNLRRTIFPLGDLTKQEVRDIAREHGYPTLAEKKESQEICFVTDNDYRSFLRENVTDYDRIIREGNYTSFPGFYGFLMRNCNTLPLSSNLRTMKKFMKGVDMLLQKGDFILVYPEQSMWWNYRKPKPLKNGAYSFAVRNNVPVLPCFITMQDSDIMGEDGFFVQEYTIHVGEPIYPNPDLSYRESVKDMLDRNYQLWKEIYEREYHMPLVYDTAELEDAE